MPVITFAAVWFQYWLEVKPSSDPVDLRRQMSLAAGEEQKSYRSGVVYRD